MNKWLSSKEKLEETRRWLSSDEEMDDAQRKTLKIFERTFSTYFTENKEATALKEELTAATDKLEAARGGMKLGYTPPGGEFIAGSSVMLRNTMRTSSDAKLREAAFAGLRSIGPFIVESGFVEVIKQRNHLAKLLGFEDFYDMKVTQAEGFGKKRLFEILDGLESRTRALNAAAREALAAEKGKEALEPFNMGFMMAGATEEKLDPYFPFEKAVEAWGRSYAALNIEYKDAMMTLDLLDREGKYSNGFCHWPQPAWTRPDGTWQPSKANFTSLADPKATGSGKTALVTLMHEAGHAAHFANIEQPSPLFSQERAPTSVAYAENQSMFLDSLVSDAAWRAKYARSREGQVLPWEIHEEELRATHPYAVFGLRSMLSVPYFEKALYELPESEVTSQRIIALADEVELQIQGGLAARPLLSVPHIISDEASCYYHGYVLAEMSVHHTRAYFLEGGKQIVDNPEVGKQLTEVYWRPGNSEMFLDLVEKLTGKPLTGDAWVDVLNEPLESLIASEKKDYAWALTLPPMGDGEIDLKMHCRIADGDKVLADSKEDGGFIAACRKFENYVKDLSKL